MISNSAFNHFLEKAIELDLLFALYREPGSQNATFVCQTEPGLKSFSSSQISFDNGFAIAPFEGNNGIIIKPNILISSYLHEFPKLNPIEYSTKFKQDEPNVISKEDYLNRLTQLISDVRSSTTNKVVYSRVKEVDFEGNFVDSFFNLEDSNPDAFVYLFNLPGKNTWFGASPEILIKKEDQTFKSVALAATRKSHNDNIVWNEKELEEHKYVSQYITQVLQKNEAVWTESELFTKELKSGLSHLCKEFHIEINSTNFFSLAQGLHPTPAVAGYPFKEAVEKIMKYEVHDRSYYTGFLGPINLLNSTSLYVNLRCAMLTPKKTYLFVGGGITKDSVADDEWQETKLKAQTILNALKAPIQLK